MTRSFRTLDDMGDITGKRVLVREDLNVPMADGAVTDDTRLRAAVSTVAELADRGAVVLVLAHFGRPKVPSPELSTAQLARPFMTSSARARPNSANRKPACTPPQLPARPNADPGPVLPGTGDRRHPPRCVCRLSSADSG